MKCTQGSEVIVEQVSPIIDYGGLQQVELFMGEGYFLLGTDDQFFLELEDLFFESAVMGDDKFSCFGGCIGFGMGHEVGNRLVFQVTDAGDDGNREFSHGAAKVIIVEQQEIRFGASAPDDDGDVLRLV